MAVTVKTDVVVPCRADRACGRLDVALGSALAGSRERGRTRISTRRYPPPRRLDRVYPAFEAAVAVTAIDDTSCLLTIAGTYEPPFGRIGAVLDRTVMHGLAASTAADFADRLGHSLAAHDKEGMP
jgi:hypothetical protein